MHPRRRGQDDLLPRRHQRLPEVQRRVRALLARSATGALDLPGCGAAARRARRDRGHRGAGSRLARFDGLDRPPENARVTASRTEPSSRTAAVVLAAGLGTRMRSRTPKILHPLCGRPMLAYVLDAWDEALVELDGTDGGPVPPVIVYSPATEAIREVVGRRGKLARQDVPRGTGDAVRAALEALPRSAKEVLVLSGDVPLVEADQLVAVV